MAVNKLFWFDWRWFQILAEVEFLPEKWCCFGVELWLKVFEDTILCLQNSHWPISRTSPPDSQVNTDILAHLSWWCIELHSDSQNYHRGWYGGGPWVEKTHRTGHCGMNRKNFKYDFTSNENWIPTLNMDNCFLYFYL